MVALFLREVQITSGGREYDVTSGRIRGVRGADVADDVRHRHSVAHDVVESEIHRRDVVPDHGSHQEQRPRKRVDPLFETVGQERPEFLGGFELPYVDGGQPDVLRPQRFARQLSCQAPEFAPEHFMPPSEVQQGGLQCPPVEGARHLERDREPGRELVVLAPPFLGHGEVLVLVERGPPDRPFTRPATPLPRPMKPPLHQPPGRQVERLQGKLPHTGSPAT